MGADTGENARVFTAIILQKREKSKPERRKKRFFAEKNTVLGIFRQDVPTKTHAGSGRKNRIPAHTRKFQLKHLYLTET